MSLSFSPLSCPNRLTIKPPDRRGFPGSFLLRARIAVTPAAGARSVKTEQESPRSWTHQISAIPWTMISRARALGFKPTPELGLFSLLFVLSTVIGAFISVTIISLPTLSAFKKLRVSADKLSKAYREEVPGTLSSLKLSSLEINDLTSQLSKLRKRITRNQYNRRMKERKTRFDGGRNNSIVN